MINIATCGKQKKEMRNEQKKLRTNTTQNVKRFVSLRGNTTNEKPTAFVFVLSWQSRLLHVFGGTTNYFVTNMNNKVVGKPTHNHLDRHAHATTTAGLVVDCVMLTMTQPFGVLLFAITNLWT